MSSLLPFLEIITAAVTDLQNVEQKNKTPVPDLSQPFHPASEAFRADPVAAEAAAKIVAASLQLAAMLAPPVEGIVTMAVTGGFKAAALRVCHESNVTEILREAGPQGLHVKDIAQQNGLEERKLARFLRFLASNHIYEEVEPNVFRNNRLSSLLDSGKPSADVFSSPDTKHDGVMGPGAFIAHHLDEINHAAAYTWENVSDPKTGHSYAPNRCPFSTWQGKEITAWEYMDQPGNELVRKRFDLTMLGMNALQPIDAILDGLEWEKLPQGSTVVDVGGGIGTYMAPLAAKFPELNFVVQDLPQSMDNARQFWDEKNPQAIADKRVILEVQNFFEPQPQRDVDVFFMKGIIHDWGDDDCKKILTTLRQAASTNTKLVLAESIVPYACRTPEQAGDSQNRVPGSATKQAPAPLLANSFTGSLIAVADMVMFIGLNGQERTFDHMQELLRSTGWRVDEVHHPKSEHAMYAFYVTSPV